MNNIFISICIPNYKRPKELERLLNTIDSLLITEVEIVVCDDKSPNADEIRAVANNFATRTKYRFVFVENQENYGYDRNLRELIKHASGEWIVFMGNDDEFVAGALDELINFLKINKNLGYVMKSHYFIHKNNKKELFKYYEGDKFFKAGEQAYLSLFRKSVFISGFTIKKDYVADLLINNFDGTLLFQLYLLAEVCLKYPSAYFDIPLTQQYDEGTPEFGSSKNEQGITPGKITPENSLRFLKGFFIITKYIDDKYSLKSTERIKLDMSKYFYPSLAIQRDNGLIVFLKYVKELNKIGFNVSFYYYVYIIGLSILGKKICNNIIRILKNLIGKTPKL
jgi:glycosyltransferase involved in cell wall biosynthesis